jgi:hypothetical protein
MSLLLYSPLICEQLGVSCGFSLIGPLFLYSLLVREQLGVSCGFILIGSLFLHSLLKCKQLSVSCAFILIGSALAPPFGRCQLSLLFGPSSTCHGRPKSSEGSRAERDSSRARTRRDQEQQAEREPRARSANTMGSERGDQESIRSFKKWYLIDASIRHGRRRSDTQRVLPDTLRGGDAY